jgi:hypothetical protein
MDEQPKLGRPSAYTEGVAAQILAEIATTKRGLAPICDARDDFPDPATFYRWMIERPDLRESYTRAKESQLQILEDEMLSIADKTEVGEIVTEKPDGTETRKADMIEHRKLRIETRKWLMGKLKPKKYGDRTTLAGDPDNPMNLRHQVDGSELIERIMGITSKPTK